MISRQQGFTLIELMIAMTMGLLLTSALGTLYAKTVQHSAENIRSLQLNHDLKMAMDVMHDDIRRAGFWADATKSIGQVNYVPNPFTTIKTDLHVHNGNRCITYSYDADLSGNISNDEFFGFRLNQEVGAIEVKVTGNSSIDCNNGTWELLTDEHVTIVEGLTFDLSTSSCINITDVPTTDCYQVHADSGDTTVEKRMVMIDLMGSLRSDQSMTLILNDTARVRNDRVIQK